MTDSLMPLAFQQQRLGVFDQFFDADQEADCLGAVYDTVIVGEREVHHGTDHDLTFDDDGALLDLVHPQYRDLGHGEDGRRDQRAEDATVGYGERSTTQVFEGQLALAGLCGQVCYALFDLREVLVVGVADHGDDEPFVRGDGHAYIVVLLEKELVPLQFGVDFRESLERPDGSLGEEAHEAESRACPLLEGLLAALPQLHDRAHVGLVEGGEHRRRLLRLDQPLGYGLAPAGDAHPLLQRRPAIRRSGRLRFAVPLGFFRLLGGRGAGLFTDQTLHVVAGDAPARTAAGDLGEVDIVLLGQPPHRRRCAACAVLDLTVAVGRLVSRIFGLRLLLLFFLGPRLLCFFGLHGGCAVAYGTDGLADVHGLALAFGDGLQHAILFGLDLEVDLVRLEFDERLTRLYGFTLLLEPAPHRRVGDRLSKLGNVYLSSHCSLFLSHSLGAEARTCVSSTACSSSKSCPTLSKADLTIPACSCLWNLAEPWAGLGRGGFPT